MAEDNGNNEKNAAGGDAGSGTHSGSNNGSGSGSHNGSNNGSNNGSDSGSDNGNNSANNRGGSNNAAGNAPGRTVPAPYRIMEGRIEAAAAIDEVIACARAELCIFDSTPAALRERDFGRPARIDALRRMLLADRRHRLRIVLHDSSGIESELPRLVNLLGLLSAQIAIHRSSGAAREARDVLLIADEAHFWRKPHIEHPRSILSLHDPVAAQPLRDRFEEIWESSELAVSAGTSGL